MAQIIQIITKLKCTQEYFSVHNPPTNAFLLKVPIRLNLLGYPAMVNNIQT